MISHGINEEGLQKAKCQDLSETDEVKRGVLIEICWLENLLAMCAGCKANVAMGNHQGNKNSSPPNNWEFESARQRGRGLSCFNLQHKLHISPRALKTSSRGRRLKRLLMMNVEKRVQSTAEQRFDTATEQLSETIKEENKHHCSPTLDFTSGFKATCTSLVLSSGSHSPESQTSNPNFCGPDGDGGNSEMDGDLSSELSEYDNELYSGNWIVEDCIENFQGKIIPQSNLIIGSTEAGLPIKHANAKESSGVLQSATSSVRTKEGQLEGVIQQNSNINSDQLRDYLVPPKHTSTSGGLKDKDSKLPMSQTQNTELRQEEVLSMEKLHLLGRDLNQSLQKALKAVQLFADPDEDWKAIRVPKTEKMNLGTVWMQDPDEFMLVCQNSPLNRVQIKSERKAALFSSFPSSSNSLGSISPLGSPCSLSLSDPVLQQCIFPLPKEEKEEGSRMQLIQRQCSDVDNSSIIGSVSAPDEPSISWTTPTLPTMLISLRTGGHITPFSHAVYVDCDIMAGVDPKNSNFLYLLMFWYSLLRLNTKTLAKHTHTHTHTEC